ncbi:hypothetical protein [Hyphomicrobium sp.]|uniref:hypothetical protein n=1 Tax=Hyphomicrobium sp. TaxID=82 RepID=UPI000F900D87|nr:hypothetical protein [Hyphomicrobium sp.]RUP00037.1 MAG: hypothetical protein EKK30_02655 [Hyphomicrobium sp.]
MRTVAPITAAIAALSLALAIPAFADPLPTGHEPSDAHGIEPGKVGPGSEKNSQVSPTSPSIPIDKQPPPEIPANAGAGTGEKGSGPEATSPPHNPTPGVQ